MTERFGGDIIYSILSNDSSITTIVSTSIYEDHIVPATDTTTETINFYKLNPFAGGADFFESRFSIDCRAADYNTSQTLAYNVFAALNREFATLSGKEYFFRCDILSTIPPVNETDVYNTPVQVYIRRKNA